MKRSFCVAMTIAFLSISAPMAVSGQAVFVGGGATMPLGGFGDLVDTGWAGFGGILLPVGEAGLSMGFEGFYSSYAHAATEETSTSLIGGLGLLGYSFGEPGAVSPFVFGGIGFASHSVNSDVLPDDKGWGPVTGIGAGVSVPLGAQTFMVAASYNTGIGHETEAFRYIGISAGFQFPVGGN